MPGGGSSTGLGSPCARLRLDVQGIVQGVGFRPFVYTLARTLVLTGEVRNTPDGVVVEVEGPPDRIADFVRRLHTDAPPLARIDDVTQADVAPRGDTGFCIVDSAGGAGRTLVPADVATCDDCLSELADPSDRRYRHAFISCTNCGPRFTIITALPYDRPATTMAGLALCATCAAEYADPDDRRFHAQTVACRDCGPTLRLVRPGLPDMSGDDALGEARRLLAAGAVVAVKGLGGYHLACDAADEDTVATLRKRKDRGDKPFAVMVADASVAAAVARLGPHEQALLADPRRPVVLLPRLGSRLAESVAPGHPDVGLLLPYTPVHHLLLGLPGEQPVLTALVMTSGNRSGEPIVTADDEARTRLAGLADAWLVHDRPITVPCDDSVVRVVADGQVLPVRRSRGFVPLPLTVPVPVRPALAVGGDLKNTFCIGDGARAWMSAHVGDMDDLATLQAFDAATEHLCRLSGVRPEVLVADAHPGYRSATWAARHADGRPVVRVQHHHAHVASAMADNGCDGTSRVIGVAFDGTGYGADGAVWGGEVLLADYDGYERAGSLRYVPLPGGDAAVRNPWRMALSHLRSAGVGWDPRLPSVTAGSPRELTVLAAQLDRGLGCVPTSSMGRLFDAMSSLAGVCHRVDYEAEAAMRFEDLARSALPYADGSYAFAVRGSSRFGIDPAPVVAAAAADVLACVEPAVVAARFHRAVAAAVVTVAVGLRARTGLTQVALTGGVFLNVVLTELCTEALCDRGFAVLRHHQVPPSDAGIALGQLVVGARRAVA